jgi:Preprotein translocase subunit YidC
MLRISYRLHQRWRTSFYPSVIQEDMKVMSHRFRQICLQQSNGTTKIRIPIIQEDSLLQSDFQDDETLEKSKKMALSLDDPFDRLDIFKKDHTFTAAGGPLNIHNPSYHQLNHHWIFTDKQRKMNDIPDVHSLSHRFMSSSSIISDVLPEFIKQYSIWGGSAIILKTFHGQNIPYWASMSLTNILVRSSLFPLVIQGAKTSVRFANVAPEVQFLISCYTRDAKTLKDANAPPSQRMELLVATWQSLRGIYKLHKVNPFDVLKSPLMQIPVFWYFSVDIRKLINGGNPELAQELTESGFLWVMDLTEPDPWYGLPILSGLLLYLNVEVAVGKQSLSGETASKSNIARYLKDGFQSKYCMYCGWLQI